MYNTSSRSRSHTLLQASHSEIHQQPQADRHTSNFTDPELDNQEQNISTLTTKTLPIIAKQMRAIDFYRVFLARHSSAKRCEMTAICLSGATVSSSSLHRVVFPHAKEPAMMVTGIGSMAGSHDSPSPLNTVFKCLLGGSRGLVVQSL